MDILDYQEGSNKDNFYFKGKKELISIILNKLKLKKKNKILTIGCGTGEELEVLKEFGDIYVIDINKEVLKLIPSKLYKKKFVMDATSLKFKDNTFDLIVALDTLEHIKDDKKVIKEIERVLKPKGHIIITVPGFKLLYGPHDIALGHIRRYKLSEVKELFNNFKIVELGFWNSLMFLPIFFYRILAKTRKRNGKDKLNINKPINFILLNIIRLENKLIEKGIIPKFGLTIFGVFKK